MAIREASHAGSWYSGDGPQLTSQLDSWLKAVPDNAQPGARVIISPHAGYAYSGPCAAWAFKYFDLSKAKRIFILHPSHHYHLRTAALPVVEAYRTPLSSEPLHLDLNTIKVLAQTNATDTQGKNVKFTTMSQDVDEAEHSSEMQLPYIHRLLQMMYPDQPTTAYPRLVPIMIGNTSPAIEKVLGNILAPYIADESNAFVISSDFCHWGSRFGYTYYLPDAPSPVISPLALPNGLTEDHKNATHTTNNDDVHKLLTLAKGQELRAGARPNNPKIYESIAHADRACMCAIASGEHNEFLRVLSETGNTVCGRHPIGTFMAGVEVLEPKSSLDGADDFRRRFRFLRYERSSDAESVRDSSVSYVSAFAVL